MTRTLRLTTLVTLAVALVAALAFALATSAPAPARQGADDPASRGAGDDLGGNRADGERRGGNDDSANRDANDDRGGRRGGDDRGKGRHGRRAARVYALPGDDVFPEGIATKPHSDRFFVSGTTDGTIYQGSRDTKDLKVFAPGGADGRTTATGMKVDGRNRLWVSGGATGKAFVLNAETGATIKVLDTHPATPGAAFINDVAFGKGYAYFTDSKRPILWRVSMSGDSIGDPEAFIDFTGSALAYQTGFNANGIASFEDGRILVVMQSNTGRLFRVDTSSKKVEQLDLGGETLVNGDGILRRGSRLYVVRNANNEIVVVKLRRHHSEGRIEDRITSPAFMFPTGVARQNGRLLVVNSQFDKRGGSPSLPFTVASIKE